MEQLGSGRFYLEKGERFPYQCPECRGVVEYKDGVTDLRCGHCGYEGDVEEFSEVEWGLVKPN